MLCGASERARLYVYIYIYLRTRNIHSHTYSARDESVVRRGARETARARAPPRLLSSSRANALHGREPEQINIIHPHARRAHESASETFEILSLTRARARTLSYAPAVHRTYRCVSVCMCAWVAVCIYLCTRCTRESFSRARETTRVADAAARVVFVRRALPDSVLSFGAYIYISIYIGE